MLNNINIFYFRLLYCSGEERVNIFKSLFLDILPVKKKTGYFPSKMVLIKWCQPSLKQMSKLKYPMQRNLLKTISTCSSVLNSDGMAKTYCQRHNLLKYQRNHSSWIQPEGFDTNINVYNSLTKQKDKLILQRKNVATWYVFTALLT